MSYVPSKRSTFLYFAYGSNLWTKRIHLQNSSAVRKGIAQLKVNSGFFSTNSERISIKNGIFFRDIVWISISHWENQQFGMDHRPQ